MDPPYNKKPIVKGFGTSAQQTPEGAVAMSDPNKLLGFGHIAGQRWVKKNKNYFHLVNVNFYKKIF